MVAPMTVVAPAAVIGSAYLGYKLTKHVSAAYLAAPLGYIAVSKLSRALQPKPASYDYTYENRNRAASWARFKADPVAEVKASIRPEWWWVVAVLAASYLGQKIAHSALKAKAPGRVAGAAVGAGVGLLGMTAYSLAGARM